MKKVLFIDRDGTLIWEPPDTFQIDSFEKLKFLPIRGSLDSRFIRVNSLVIRTNGSSIPVSYSLVSQQGQWKIYDLSVEGVSLLQSFRSQFAQALQNGNVQSLIKQMRERAKAVQ